MVVVDLTKNCGPMKPEKVFVEKITPKFELKAMIHMKPDFYLTQKLAFRGLDLPDPYSQKGRALRKYLTTVIGSIEFLAVRRYEKNAFLRFNTDFFYLPGEGDFRRVAAKGRHLNRELLELGLARPYDENKRKIDFSKRRIRVKNVDIDLGTGNFKSEVCMYINDCKQYLRAALERKPVNMEKGEFDPTDEEFLIIYGLKELKDMSMILAGRPRLDWKGN